jgi:hypothetical protein
MAGKVDLNKIKEEIDVRKKERGVMTERVQGATLMPKDQFLNGLMTSLQTGQDTAATNLIKLVENKTAAKHGEIVRHAVNETVLPTTVPTANVRPIQGGIPLEQVDMSPERDEQMFRDLEAKRKKTLAESMNEYINAPHVGAPMSNQQVAIPPATTYMSNGTTRVPMLNEAYLVENVNKIVHNYLAENLGPVFEEAIKSTIIEMYAVERIKEVLQENREMIKTVVIETIKEIQARSKKAQ